MADSTPDAKGTRRRQRHKIDADRIGEENKAAAQLKTQNLRWQKGFIRTLSGPPIFYLPAKHTPETSRLLEESSKDMELEYLRWQKGFIRTLSGPPIFYLPAKHTPETSRLLEESSKDTEVLIDVLNQNTAGQLEGLDITDHNSNVAVPDQLLSIPASNNDFPVDSTTPPAKEKGANEQNDERVSEPIQTSTTETAPPAYEAINDCIIRCNVDLFKVNEKVSKCFCVDSDCATACTNREAQCECPSTCLNGENCKNQRFKKRQYAKLEVFDAGKKGWGIRAVEPIPKGTFIIEYVGEIVDDQQLKKRVERYANSDTYNRHHYVMALETGLYIDSTRKGNISRFTNHSCDPNARIHKWVVVRRSRIGLFAIKDIKAREEIAIDYQFERVGEEDQECYCGSSNCRGVLSVAKPNRQEKRTLASQSKPKV